MEEPRMTEAQRDELKALARRRTCRTSLERC